MGNKNDAHLLVQQFKALQYELGRIPTAQEFMAKCTNLAALRTNFSSYEKLIFAASAYDEGGTKKFDPLLDVKLEKQFKKICSTRSSIQGHFVDELDLKELFQRAGNPATLKATVQPDSHLKYVDRRAYNCFKKFMSWYQPDIDILLGDYLDCEGISHWPNDSLEPRKMVPEILMGREDLKHRKLLTPKTSTRIFLTGNHEIWIEQAMTRLPEFFHGIDKLGYDFSLNGLLGLEELGYELFPLNHLVRIGKAHFTHGLYTGSNHAKKHVQMLKCNIYYGHLHDNQVYNETSIYGNIEAASHGCLARLDARFLKNRPNNWLHGFGVFEFFPDGNFTRLFVPIFDGKCSFAGMVFDGND